MKENFVSKYQALHYELTHELIRDYLLELLDKSANELELESYRLDGFSIVCMIAPSYPGSTDMRKITITYLSLLGFIYSKVKNK